jgi:ferredoxin
MKIVVDYTLCEGNAVCMRLCPEVFEIGDDDRAHLRVQRPPEELREKVLAAVHRCPRQALSVVED